ncbi:MAG: DUF89 family protein, partial [Mariniphaga sp.]|nr:DUF89 family protein [Mariniphaga sp.]
MDSLPKRMEKFGIKPKEKEQLLGELETEILNIDLKNSYSPEITRNILEKLKSYSKITDPYKHEKEKSNNELLNRYKEFQQLVNSSSDPFDTALRLAIAGNIIDFGPGNHFDVDETIKNVLTSKFAIDDSKQLKSKISKAKTIFYLGDNCGEIVLDKLFLETINHPNVWFAVRDKPVLNDVTINEAEEVGIDQVAK